MKRNIFIGSTLAALLLALGIGQGLLEKQAAAQDKSNKIQVPRFEVDPTFPKPLPNHWYQGMSIGVGVDANDHVWIVHRPDTVNALEAAEDPTGTWRREVNRRLATDYAELFGRIDMLVMLKVPDFAAVRANRRLQEQKLGAGPAVMDDAALDRFLAHYQRLTEWMFAEMPPRADILLDIGRDQRPTRLSTTARSV